LSGVSFLNFFRFYDSDFVPEEGFDAASEAVFSDFFSEAAGSDFGVSDFLPDAGVPDGASLFL
jgi:hypothetical protein